jgi:restriction endonuclease S subunit
MKELQNRKKSLIQQLKELNKKEQDKMVSEEEYLHEKMEIERELVEIMDRLTQLNYIFKK